MQQMKLFNDEASFYKAISNESVNAVFHRVGENSYEVELEVNSNKFLLFFTTIMGKIEKFEIIAVKGFVNLSVNIVRILKKIVYKLYFDY